MPMPEEFAKLCVWFHQDMFTHFETAEQAIEHALGHLSVAQRDVVSAYLDQLLSGKYNEEELQRVWRASGAGVSITTGREGDSARFLRRIRSVIDDLARRSAH
jgi:hypothetical protein